MKCSLLILAIVFQSPAWNGQQEASKTVQRLSGQGMGLYGLGLCDAPTASSCQQGRECRLLCAKDDWGLLPEGKAFIAQVRTSD